MARRSAGGRLLGLDLVDNGCRIIELNTSSDPMEVTGRGIRLPGPLGKVPPAEVGRALRRGLEAAHISARQVVAAIPRHLAILKPLVLPRMSMEETAAAVRLQAERELPFGPAEARIDFAPTAVVAGNGPASAGGESAAASGTTASPPTGFLLGAVQRDVAQALKSALAGAGLSVRRIGLRPCATASALVFAAPDFGDDFIGLVDLGDRMTEIDIIRSGHLVFSRSATMGSSPTIEAVSAEDDPAAVEVEPVAADEGAADDPGGLALFDQWERALLGEVRRSLEAFSVQPGGAAVSRLYLTGAGADERLAGALAETLQVPVAAFDPFDRVRLVGRARTHPPEGLRAFTTALGLAVEATRAPVPGFDFLTSYEERGRPARLRRRSAAAVGALVVAALLIAVPTILLAVQHAKLGRLESRQTELETEVAVIRTLEKRLDDLAPWTDPDERTSWREVLYEVVNRIWPAQRRAYLTKLTLQRGNTIILDGRAHNPAVVEAVMDGLRENTRFGVPEIGFQRWTEDRDGYPVVFQIKVEWQGGPPRAVASQPGDSGPEAPGSVEGS